MKTKALVIIFFFNLSVCLAQDGGYTSKFWKSTRYEVILSSGTANYFGDLSYVKHYRKSSSIKTTRPNIGINGRFKILNWIALKGSINYVRLVGDDKHSEFPYIYNRNLNFKSNIGLVSLLLETSLLTENRGKRYIFQKNSIWNNMNIYISLGLGGFYFNPKTELNGRTYSLQPLGTEGQNITNKKYSLFSTAFVSGFGFKYYLTRHWNIGFDLNFYATNTDYLDDVSSNYYNNVEIENSSGTIAAQLADRRIDPLKEFEGTLINERGNTFDNDGFLLFSFNITYTFENKVRKSKFQK